MVNILLIDLGTPRDELSEPIGIETIKPYVETVFPDVAITLRSIEIDNIKNMATLNDLNIFDIIGISTKIRAYDRLSKLINHINQFCSDKIIVLGDILSTFAYRDVLNLFPNVICVRGEGEEAFPGIIEKFLIYNHNFRNYLNDVPNLAFINNDRLYLTKRSTINVRYAKHPSRSLLPNVIQQNGIAHLEASRGCIYNKCSFCGINEKYNNAKWRPFELDFVMKELETLTNLGVKSPYFTDEDFFGNNIERIITFCNKVISAKKLNVLNPSLNFYFNARVDSILGKGFDEIIEPSRILALLQKAGLREIFIGIESGSNNQITRYNKFITRNKSIKAINMLLRYDIDIDVGFIFFDPNSSVNELLDNIHFIYDSGLQFNYSRLLKKLRLHPYTNITQSYLDNYPNARLNLDLISYEYEFLHQEVADIYYSFYQWEIEDLDIIYNLQSYVRGEVINEIERREIKNIISCYRYLDIEFLKELINVYKQGSPSKIKLLNITGKFNKIRDYFDNNLINRIKWFDSSYRRYGKLSN